MSDDTYTATTDENGKATFPDVPSGAFEVLVAGYEAPDGGAQVIELEPGKTYYELPVNEGDST